ncbi:MAG: sigma-54-dependent Fis family transcriptional regulator [Nitrosomonadales bacterium]|nr:sigma-54-dependent Fis family transcriptional regulator [Nitrosomonadales bacterium]
MLIVDDDPLIRDALQLSLADEFDVRVAENRARAIGLLREMPDRMQLALVDLGLPPTPHRPEEGFHLIAELLAHSPDIKILVLSGQDEESNARHARTLGASDFIAKPCSPEKIRKLLRDALLVRHGEQEKREALLGIVGHSAAIQAIRSQIALYAATPFPVLIEGESGSGKELVAAALQRLSPHSESPYVIFNCAAISPSLIESALFGHSKGAFTGASTAQTGFFEGAGNGALFLDEIGELPLEMQAKLLRVLENGEYQRVGESAMRKSNARIIAATNRGLRGEVRSGRFRADLYHRLSVFTIQVPPLREMGADKMLLLNHFRDFYASQSGNAPFILDATAIQLWERYSFPGNTRELRNIIIRLATKYPGQTVAAAQLEAELDLQQVAADDPGAVADDDPRKLARETLRRQPNFSLDNLLQAQGSHYIDAALELAGGNVSEAAKLLGLHRTTLYSRMEALQKYKAVRHTAGEQ